MPKMSGTLSRNLKLLGEKGTVRALGKAMREEEEVDLKEVIQRTPVKTGNLRATEKVGGPVFEGNGVVRVWIQAGGGLAAGYAVPVHENLDAFHPIGQAKYLESVVMESAPYMARRVGARMDWKEVLI